jgi:hypothetical protein
VLVEPVGLELPRAVRAAVVSAARQRVECARVRLLTDVPVAGPRAGDLHPVVEAGRLELAPHHDLGDR